MEQLPSLSVPLNECLIAWSQDADCLKILSPDFKFLGSVECPSSVKSVIYNDSTDELLTGGMGETFFQTFLFRFITVSWPCVRSGWLIN